MQRILVFTLLLMSTSGFAQFKLARLFTDHAVLQRQKTLPVWGLTKPNETVIIILAGQTQRTKADTLGKWMVRFSPFEAGGPHKLVAISAKDSIVLKDLLFGDVWLCSGQSNMEWTVGQSNNFANEKKNADFSEIRHFRVDHEVTIAPKTDLQSGHWKICSAETVGEFTGVGYFFAREVYQKMKVPIGLLHSSWGGSQIESWISKEAMMASPELKEYAQILPKSWEEADAYHDKKMRRQILGADITPSVSDEKNYLLGDYDISKWLVSDPMGQWDWKGVWAFRGNGYMARVVDIPLSMTEVQTTLALAENDSYNEIYINGKLVSAGIIKGVRKIIVPAKFWTQGENQLMIKFGNMIDPAWYGLGLNGSPNDLYVSAGNERISIADNWKLMPSFADKHEYVHSSNNAGTTIYNGMIAPLLPYAIKGALWYQGESNAGRAYQYRKTFPLMIQDWRQKWGDNFPFYFVQLATYGGDQNSNQGSNWAELREAQTMTLQLPQTGMAVTTDIGNPNDIHPTNKQDVGKRLAASALKLTYNQDVVPAGPMYESTNFQDNKAIISFKYTGKGLVVKNRYGYLQGFEVAGGDKVFYYAKAEIQGDKIVVYHPKGIKPASVRYAWSDAPVEANLFNMEGFPACPFRTDDWQGVTVKGKFD